MLSLSSLSCILRLYCAFGTWLIGCLALFFAFELDTRVFWIISVVRSLRIEGLFSMAFLRLVFSLCTFAIYPFLRLTMWVSYEPLLLWISISGNLTFSLFKSCLVDAVSSARIAWLIRSSECELLVELVA